MIFQKEIRKLTLNIMLFLEFKKEGKIDYPNNFIGVGNTDKIVIKVDKYSVTQFVDENVGICISDNALKDPCSEGDQQYQCTSAKNMGEINIFDTCDPNDKEGGKDKYCSVSAMETKWYYMTVVSVVVKR